MTSTRGGDFLFNLNSFSDRSHPDDGSSSNSLLAGLNAFTPQDTPGASANLNSTGSNPGTTVASPSTMMMNANSFADQLDLWTNASFSFDGPTGHALLLDEEKDEGQGSTADGNRNNNNNNLRPDDHFRSTPTPAGPNDHRNQPFIRNGKARERSENDMGGVLGHNGPSHHDHQQVQGNNTNGNSNGPLNHEPTHREHKLAADNFLQSEYFAPPTSSAGEARRPGFGASPLLSHNNPNAAAYSRRHAENAAGARGPQSLGENIFSQFQVDAQGQNNDVTEGDNANAIAAAAAAAGFGGLSPELLQALAFQQILSGASNNGGAGNGQFGGVNPFGFPGAFNGNNAGPAAQQNGSWPLQQHGQNNLASAAAAHFGTGPTTFGAGAPAATTDGNALQQQHPHHHHAPPPGVIDQQQRNIWGASNVFGNVSAAASDRQGSHDEEDQNASDDAAEDDKPAAKGKKAKSAASKETKANKRQRNSTTVKEENTSASSNAKASRSNAPSAAVSSASDSATEDFKNRNEDSDDEDAQVARALRDDIPPLKLIDTGNPEADAEANRLAIEEDKRRRNTAASARFRIKKKQREQALEQAARQLERKVRSLQEENERLSTENGWLKNLITTRPNGGGAAALNGAPSGASFSPSSNPSSNPLLAAAAAASAANNGPHGGSASFPGMPSTFPGTGLQPMRDSGLQPRGVGTASNGANGNEKNSNAKKNNGNNNKKKEAGKHAASSDRKNSGAVVGDAKGGQATLVGGKRGREE